MTGNDFIGMCRSSVLVLDGATGTELAKRGMPAGICPEEWVLQNPAAINEVQWAYEDAGSRIVYTPTFGGNRIKLAEFGLDGEVVSINRRLAEIARAGLTKAKVFGDMAPTGKFIEPFGEMGFEEAVTVYKEQARGLLEGGVEGFAIETMMDLQEARAALIAVRELCDLPVIVTMTFGEGGRTLTGNTPSSAIVALQALGASAVGCNCSAGPGQMCTMVSEMRSCARVPIVAKPNAGMPRFADGRTVFDMGPEEFGTLASMLVDAGASIVGGCCGTTPEHLASLAEKVSTKPVPGITVGSSYVSSASRVLKISMSEPFGVIGERLNPTGKKALQADLRSGAFELVRKFAVEQSNAGAVMLDVNCGLPGVDESAALRKVVSILAADSQVPLCIDTTNPEAAEAALRLYPGRALFNSISAETKRIEKVLPIAAKYGAMIIALPLDDNGIPATVGERAANVKAIYDAASKYGYNRWDMVVDGLVMTVSANPEAAETTLGTIEWCAREWGTCSVCGLSNISFGLPRRDLVNRAFLSMAIGRGLNLAIANPMNADIMDTCMATDVLGGRDSGAARFIAAYSGVESAPKASVTATALEPPLAARQALVNGDCRALDHAIDECLKTGLTASTIVDTILVPAIGEVGEKYERQEFFLPQLMAGAKAMKMAMDKMGPLLAKDGGDTASAGRVIIATVKGDIHDIGKNIVSMMLRNYNFEVIDLGKDVPAGAILDAAAKENVSIIALSALMTTTMGEMRNVIELASKRGQTDLHFIVGGAVVDEAYAASIGAVYSRDAMATVRAAQQFSQH